MAEDNGGVDAAVRFGMLLRAHRTRIGLTQRELADLSTISVRAIRDLEQGRARKPRADTVRLIADGLRLGRTGRAELEEAADSGRACRSPRGDYPLDLAPPPAAAGPLVGRDAELALVAGELADDAVRLVDVVGLAGVGKTRLACAVAAQVHARHRWPVLWASAPEAREPRATGVRDVRLADAVDACAAALGEPGVPRRGVVEFAELVGDRPTLLVLDGFDAVDAVAAEPVAWLLGECAGLRIVRTAVRPACLPGARRFLLAPLRTPVPGEQTDVVALARVPSVRLFLDHVARVWPGWRPDRVDAGALTELALLLDGVPRAIAAAASWIGVYDLNLLRRALTATPAALLEHLSGAESRACTVEGLTCSLRDLPDGDVLDALVAARATGLDLDDLAVRTGRNLPEVGRAVRGLLVRGLLRPDPGHATTFRAHSLVRAVARTAVPA